MELVLQKTDQGIHSHLHLHLEHLAEAFIQSDAKCLAGKTPRPPVHNAHNTANVRAVLSGPQTEHCGVPH